MNTYTTIKVGTINELTGIGEEWLVDARTRQYVLAKFLNGNFLNYYDVPIDSTLSDQPTIVMRETA